MAEDPRSVRQLGHDLRNNLFVISLGLQTLELGARSDEYKDLLSKMRAEVTAAEKIADALQGIEPTSTTPEANR